MPGGAGQMAHAGAGGTRGAQGRAGRAAGELSAQEIKRQGSGQPAASAQSTLILTCITTKEIYTSGHQAPQPPPPFAACARIAPTSTPVLGWRTKSGFEVAL